MDTILFNGKIRTMAGRCAAALAIKDGVIEAVGSDEEILALKTSGSTLMDLRGCLTLPGFTDSHMHMLYTGVGEKRLDLRGVSSAQEIVRRGRKYIREHSISPGDWIIGYGFDHNSFQPPVLPDMSVAEAISKEHPVLLDRICGHVGTVNSAALAAAGFDRSTRIEGGILEKDAQGNLTGILCEAALDKIRTFIPRPTQTQIEETLRDIGAKFAAVGLTAVHSDDLGPEGTDWDTLSAAVKALEARGELMVRIHEEWLVSGAEELRRVIERGFYSGSGGDSLRLCNIKLITDGSLGARTAFLRADYSDDAGNRGISVYTQEQLDELIRLCHGAGLQSACHAIGDGAAQQCIDAVEKAVRSEPKDLRHRIVHCQIGDLQLYQRMAALGMGADIQPAFTATDSPLVASRLGARGAESYAWKTMLDCGVTLGGGSDSPVESFSPIWGIYCAVTRSDGSGAPPWMPEQCLSVEEAVALYTTGAAKLACQEERSGTLEPGKLADIVVLDRDIFSIPQEEIKNASPLLTLRGGKVTHIEKTISF